MSLPIIVKRDSNFLRDTGAYYNFSVGSCALYISFSDYQSDLVRK